MPRISWTAKKANGTVVQEADPTKSLINRIRKRQVTLFGHEMRRGKLEHLVTTRKNAAGENRVKRC